MLVWKSTILCLKKGSYIQWSSIFMRYIESKPNGKYLKHSIEHGPYQRRVATIPENPNTNQQTDAITRVQLDSDLEAEDKKQDEVDAYAIICILLGIPNSIYSSVDCCKNAKNANSPGFFLESCIEEVNRIEAKGNSLHVESWVIVGRKLSEAFGITTNQKQLKNKFDY
ncbi:hypothetical protein Tco_1204722 [Tanacetum coccineum]